MKKVFLLVITLFVLISCEKEEQINKNLWNSTGTWNINKLDIDNPSILPVKLELRDAGKFYFYKDGTGEVAMSVYGQNFEEAFTYESTENTLILKGTGNNMIITDEEMVFDLFWKKNYMVLTNESITEEVDEDENITTTSSSTKFTLRKLKK